MLPTLDPERFLEFLSRPRTISEIADHFVISLGEAERLVKRTVESGEALLGSQGVTRRSSGEVSHGGEKSAHENLSRKLPSVKPKWPRAQMHMVQSNLGLGSYTGSLFKIEKGGPVAVLRKPQPIVISNPTQRKKTVGSPGSLSIAQRILVYEALLKGAKTSTELRKCSDMTPDSLHGLLRSGLIVSSWGPKGVGILYKITQEGIGELARLRAASRIGVGLGKRSLISSKTMLTH